MPVKIAPFWWEDSPRPNADEIELPQKTDIAVIGGGYSGLSAALVLARGGATVTVFEAGVLGAGASTLNGGMVGPSFHKLGVVGLEKKYGLTKANEILQESIRFVDYLENFLTTEGIDADFKRTGRFRGALRPNHYDDMARQLEILQKSLSIEGKMLSKADLHQETGSSLFCGGSIYPQDGRLHPAKYHDGLVQVARKAGVIIAAKTAVIGLTKTASGFSVKTARGDVQATQIAVCTNGYTGPLTHDLRRRIIPLRSAMIATAPIAPELMKQLMPKGRVYGDSRRLVTYYRPSPDGRRILFGSRASSLKDNPEANIHNLHASLTEVFPQLANVEITHTWSGLVAYTFDHVPHIGQFSEGKLKGMFYAMGYCGSGVARSTYFGSKLGLKMLGDPNSKTAFDDLTFETKPFYNGKPWFMPAVFAWHRLADRFGL